MLDLNRPELKVSSKGKHQKMQMNIGSCGALGYESITDRVSLATPSPCADLGPPKRIAEDALPS